MRILRDLDSALRSCHHSTYNLVSINDIFVGNEVIKSPTANKQKERQVTVKWSNVAALCVVLTAAVLAVRYRNGLGIAVAGLGRMGPGNTPEERFYGFLVLGLLLVTLVVVVRLIVEAGGRNGDR